MALQTELLCGLISSYNVDHRKTPLVAACDVAASLCWLAAGGPKNNKSKIIGQFLADRTNGRAIGTLLRPSSSSSSSACDVMYCG